MGNLGEKIEKNVLPASSMNANARWFNDSFCWFGLKSRTIVWSRGLGLPSGFINLKQVYQSINQSLGRARDTIQGAQINIRILIHLDGLYTTPLTWTFCVK